MKMKKNAFSYLMLAGIMLLGFTSCSDSDDGNAAEQEGNARLTVNMVDAPGDYDAVNVDVQGVEIIYANDTNVNLNVESEMYNLLDLTGGVYAQLAVLDEVPAGTISQIRLILGDNNTVVVDGQTNDLQTPSAQQSGLKVQLNQTLEPGYDYEYTLDFDVEESIVEQGNGGYLLKPVIRASATASTGIIEGSVSPAIPALVTASNGSVEVSAYTSLDGSFALYGLPEGEYTLTITPAIDTNLNVYTETNVMVVSGETNFLTAITLGL